MNELGSPLARKQAAETVIGPQKPKPQPSPLTSSSPNAKPLPVNREKVAFGLNPPGLKTQQSGQPDKPEKPRIVMQIKNGKVTTFEKSPNGKSKIVGDSEKLKSKLVPYGDDSESDTENAGIHRQKNGSPSKILQQTPSKFPQQAPNKIPLQTTNDKKNKESVDVIFDKKLNTTTSVPGNANLLDSSLRGKNDHTFSPNRRIDGLNLMGHKPKVSPQKLVDKTKSFCDASGILCVSANTSKLKANSTDSKWHVISQECAPSPSIGSNSSKDSVNSTSEWHVKDDAETPVFPKVPDRQCPGWKIENKESSGSKSKDESSKMQSKNLHENSVLNKTETSNTDSSKSHAGERAEIAAKSVHMDHQYTGTNQHHTAGSSKPSEVYKNDRVDVSEKQGLLTEEDVDSERLKLKKHKKHKKHKKEGKEFKYQELVNESSSGTDVPVKKHKKKKHKHRKDRDSDSEDRRDRKRKYEGEEYPGKRQKSDDDSDEFVWVEKTNETKENSKGRHGILHF